MTMTMTMTPNPATDRAAFDAWRRANVKQYWDNVDGINADARAAQAATTTSTCQPLGQQSAAPTE